MEIHFKKRETEPWGGWEACVCTRCQGLNSASAAHSLRDLESPPLGLSFPVCEVGMTLAPPSQTCVRIKRIDWHIKHLQQRPGWHLLPPSSHRAAFPQVETERAGSLTSSSNPVSWCGWNWWNAPRGLMPVQPNVYCFISVQRVLRCASAMNNKNFKNFHVHL